MNHYALLVGDGNSAANGEKESFWFFETDAESIADALNKLEKRIRRIAIPDTYDPEEWDSYASYIFNRDDIDLGGAWLLAYNENGEVQELFPMHILNDPDEKSFSYFTHVHGGRTGEMAYSTKQIPVTIDLIRQYFPDFPLSDSDPDYSVRKNDLENGAIKGFEPIDYTVRERKNPDWGSGAAVRQTGAERIARYMMRLKSPNFNPWENEDDGSALVQLIQLKNTRRIEGFTAEDLKLIDDMIVKWNFNRAIKRSYRIKRALDNICNDIFIPTDPQDLKDMRYLLDLKAADALTPPEVKKLDAVCKKYNCYEVPYNSGKVPYDYLGSALKRAQESDFNPTKNPGDDYIITYLLKRKKDRNVTPEQEQMILNIAHKWGRGFADNEAGNIESRLMRTRQPDFNPDARYSKDKLVLDYLIRKKAAGVLSPEQVAEVNALTAKWKNRKDRTSRLDPLKQDTLWRYIEMAQEPDFNPDENDTDNGILDYLISKVIEDEAFGVHRKRIMKLIRKWHRENQLESLDDISEAVDPSKKWTREEIQHLIDTRDEMCYRSLMMLYERQTEDEKADNDVKHNNGMGFRFMDAEFLTSLAESYKKYHRLTPKQLEVLRKKLQHYVGQLTKIANGKL